MFTLEKAHAVDDCIKGLLIVDKISKRSSLRTINSIEKRLFIVAL